ncbi:DUF1266 domain-containing protein [Microbacterium sp. CFBP9023]|uniref:DUF1266 domain-containing protein n=1 Tax=Microbacterium sp. CFBP9023 TaxID=3096535 RepID=UPI002A6A4210|nr:DUF1266 domain-containing protein [Microbacterium sp. CFBP9023]MDY0984215.1 DUF1266 domain-containing protein [Microbacterium sp. CFBP9023]
MSPTSWFTRPQRLAPSERFSTTDTEANEIALGLLQISSLPSGPWNDPTAPSLGPDDRALVAETWGIRSRDDWLGMIDHLSTVRRRRQAWMLRLAVRNDLDTALGRVPTTREWLAGIVAEGGDARDALPFVAGIERIEREVRRRVGKDVVTPDVYVRTLDAYALGQAVAMTTWGVALGYADVAEARRIIHRINVDTRPSFVSWVDFGLSYIAGRVMHWSDGNLDAESFEKYGEVWTDFATAVMPKRNGPWATMPWPATIDQRSRDRIG